MQLNLTPEDIDNLVKTSIMQAGFGKAVEAGIQKALAPGYDNPIEKAVKAYVVEVVGTLLRERFANEVKATVAAMMEKMVTFDVLERVTVAAVKKMVDAAYDR